MALQRVAQVVADFFGEAGVDSAFVVSGGAALHLIHALAEQANITCIPVNHEQTAAFAADGYSRVSGKLGLAVATSGPGATNLVTGIAGAFYDSVPLVVLTGQVSRSRMLKINGLRQYGFQETPFTELVRPISKGAFLVEDPRSIRMVLEQATWLATSGRPGPVVIDIPDDVQRELVEFDELVGFDPFPESPVDITKQKLGALKGLLATAKRPVIVLGGGVMNPEISVLLANFVAEIGAPVVKTWAASGVLESSHKLDFGFFGTHGSRVANFVIQNADLVLSLGCRLDTKATGSPASVFAREAKKVLVEIDPVEIEKFSVLGVQIDLSFNVTAEEFLSIPVSEMFQGEASWSEWVNYCELLRGKIGAEDFEDLREFHPNPYDLLRYVSNHVDASDIVISDTGLSLPYVMEGLASRGGKRVFHDFNNTAMGWSIGAAIGAARGAPSARVLIVLGDGSLAMGLSDLSTLAAIKTGAKILLFDNAGHGMIRQTQDQWFESSYVASSASSGISFPDWRLTCDASGINYLECDSSDFQAVVGKWLADGVTSLLRVVLNENWVVRPQTKFGFPNEDQDPPLNRDLFNTLMLVAQLPQSRSRKT